jgi:hypothetical protein
MSEDQCCNNCRFCHVELTGDITVSIQCRRYAPRKLHGVGTGYESDRWPVIAPDDWCGEFEPKKE